MNRKSVTIINLLLIGVLCVSITSCDRGNKAVMAVVEPEPPPDILLTLTHKDANSLNPINDITEWDGWRQSHVWEQSPDGTRTPKPDGYLNFPEMDIWEHWIYSHATSVLKYDISGIEPTRFGTYFALANPCGSAVSMQILALSDRKQIYQSKELRLEDNGTYIEFNIPKGTEILTIEVNELGSPWCDHFVFGEPKLFFSPKTSEEQ